MSPQLCRVKLCHFSQPFCMALALPAAAPYPSYKFQPPRFSGFAPLRDILAGEEEQDSLISLFS